DAGAALARCLCLCSRSVSSSSSSSSRGWVNRWGNITPGLGQTRGKARTKPSPKWVFWGGPNLGVNRGEAQNLTHLVLGPTRQVRLALSLLLGLVDDDATDLVGRDGME